jgi:OOP family OmpA-OmpF porin
MNKKLLCAALLAGLSVAQAASAQEFDDRWYLTGSAGYNSQDNDRRTNDTPFLTLGLGKFVSPNWSVDGELNYQNPNFDGGVEGANNDLNWSQYGLSIDLRRHFISEGRGWNPYVVAGLGYQRSEEEYDAFPNPDSPGRNTGGNFAAKIGAGLQATFAKRVSVRTELAYRADFNDTSFAAEGGPDWEGYPHQQEESFFGDIIASVGVVIPLGSLPVAAVAEPPPPPPPAPEPTPAPITIDLNGVNFNFDKATLRPDALAILAEATEILKRYPELRVEVAGHTDLCGAEDYNQKLSERRATAVYEYLTTNGVDASRLAGPVGYGESRPLEPTPQTFPACKSEKNRRTELNVQN